MYGKKANELSSKETNDLLEAFMAPRGVFSRRLVREHMMRFRNYPLHRFDEEAGVPRTGSRKDVELVVSLLFLDDEEKAVDSTTWGFVLNAMSSLHRGEERYARDLFETLSLIRFDMRWFHVITVAVLSSGKEDRLVRGLSESFREVVHDTDSSDLHPEILVRIAIDRFSEEYLDSERTEFLRWQMENVLGR